MKNTAAAVSPDHLGRGRIISGAMELFAERGFDGVSTKEIALAAGLTIGAMYHHFKGKEALYEATILKALETLPDAPVEKTGTSPREKLERLTAWFTVAISAETAVAKLLRREFADPRLSAPIGSFSPFKAPLLRFGELLKLLDPGASVELAEAAIISLLFGVSGLRGLRKLASGTVFDSDDPEMIARVVCSIVFDGILNT